MWCCLTVCAISISLSPKMGNLRATYLTSIVVTLYAGSVMVSDERLRPLFRCDTGWTTVCAEAEGPVIW